jgi:hypothetical protein
LPTALVRALVCRKFELKDQRHSCIDTHATTISRFGDRWLEELHAVSMLRVSHFYTVARQRNEHSISSIS